MNTIRQPAVAGVFYPEEPELLRAEIHRYLSAYTPGAEIPKAIIAPHAGYIYSGPVAAAAYARVAKGRGTLRKVVLLGPAHRVGFCGFALSSAHVFHTPLGDVPVDTSVNEALCRLPHVRVFDHAHTLEHSLEVHLPFLQETLASFTLVPIVIGETETAEVAAMLERLWGGPETLVVVSSDLSHYHDCDTAERLDKATTHAIEALAPERIGSDDACGCYPIRGLLHFARCHGYQVETLDLRNSGETAGPRDRVVGYGAYAFH